ncbi:MAG: hypothetical protein HC892_07650 [Saprospiraceae bacterium]|nr:hypothetical protein [Saprospiraceae bacterium]
MCQEERSGSIAASFLQVLIQMIPFDKAIFADSLKHAVILAGIGFLVIQLIWGEIIIDDLIGMFFAIPLIAYMIHIIRLFK